MKIRVSSAFPVQMAVVMPPQNETMETWDALWCPFQIRGPDGIERPVQWEKHELADDGNRLKSFEVWFENVGAGEYELVRTRRSTRDERPKPGRFAQGCLQRAPRFLIDGVSVPTEWAEQNNDRRYERHGKFAATAKFYGEHFVGFVTVFDGLDVALYELLFHNCQPLSSDLFFDELKMDVGGIWTALGWPERSTSLPTLIAKRSTPELNMLERKGTKEFLFALASAPDGGPTHAQSLVAAQHVAVCLPAIVGVQRIEMPDMASEGSSVRALVDSSLNGMRTAISNGTQVGTAADKNKTGRVGFKSFWGGNYGGATSGSYRFPVEGWQARVPGVPVDLVLQELGTRAMMVCNRTSGLVLGPRGGPINAEEWGGWDVSASDLLFERNGAQPDYRDGDFGFARAPQVVDPDRFPADDWNALSTYSTDADRVSPIDWQHFDRCYQPDAGKAELCGAPLSKLRLRAYANMATMSLRTGGFASEAARCASMPGQGTEFGRGEAHMISLVCHAYRYAPPREREPMSFVLRVFAKALVDAQMTSGLFQARMRKENTDPNNNAYVALGQGRYAVAKMTEEALLANALWSIHETARIGQDLKGDVRFALIRWASDGLWRFAWRSGATGPAPVDYVCVRGAARGSAALASWWDLPPIIKKDAAGNVISSTSVAGHSGWDLSEVSMGLAAALEYGDNDALLRACALHYCGKATSPAQARTWLLARADWDERLGLLRALERMG